MLKDFRAFIMKGNVVDMAVGIVIGIAFGLIVTSVVKDIVMPPIGLALGKVDFQNLYVVLREGTTAGPYASLAAAQTAGADAVRTRRATGKTTRLRLETEHGILRI